MATLSKVNNSGIGIAGFAQCSNRIHGTRKRTIRSSNAAVRPPISIRVDIDLQQRIILPDRSKYRIQNEY